MKQHFLLCASTTLIALAIFALASCDVFAMSDPEPGGENFTFRNEGNDLIVTGYTGDARGRHITIPQSIGGVPVTHIDHRAFNSRGITSVYIPYGITTIWMQAFYNNYISEVHIPDSITSIQPFAFANNRITSITLPPERNILVSSVFTNNHLESFYVPLGFKLMNYLFSNNRLTQLTFADGFRGKIPSGTFANNRLEVVVIPLGVTYIGVGAFIGNPLTSITIGADFVFAVWWEGEIFYEGIAFGHGFEEFYIANDRRAGTYVRTSATSADWRLLE
jgi:hypothetical protein